LPKREIRDLIHIRLQPGDQILECGDLSPLWIGSEEKATTSRRAPNNPTDSFRRVIRVSEAGKPFSVPSWRVHLAKAKCE